MNVQINFTRLNIQFRRNFCSVSTVLWFTKYFMMSPSWVNEGRRQPTTKINSPYKGHTNSISVRWVVSLRSKRGRGRLSADGWRGTSVSCLLPLLRLHPKPYCVVFSYNNHILSLGYLWVNRRDLVTLSFIKKFDVFRARPGARAHGFYGRDLGNWDEYIAI